MCYKNSNFVRSSDRATWLYGCFNKLRSRFAKSLSTIIFCFPLFPNPVCHLMLLRETNWILHQNNSFLKCPCSIHNIVSSHHNNNNSTPRSIYIWYKDLNTWEFGHYLYHNRNSNITDALQLIWKITYVERNSWAVNWTERTMWRKAPTMGEQHKSFNISMTIFS